MEEEDAGKEGADNAEELTKLNEEDHAEGLFFSRVNFISLAGLLITYYISLAEVMTVFAVLKCEIFKMSYLSVYLLLKM